MQKLKNIKNQINNIKFKSTNYVLVALIKNCTDIESTLEIIKQEFNNSIILIKQHKNYVIRLR